MEINNRLNKLVKQKQDLCEHFYQDRVTTDEGVFCGACGVELDEAKFR